MTEASATPVSDQLPFEQSYWDYLPDIIQDYIFDMAEKEHQRELAAKALHKQRMTHVCAQIKAHYHWIHICFFPTLEGQRCVECGNIISPEFVLGRHRGVCSGIDYWRVDEDEEDEDGPLAHASFYSHLYPHSSRSSYASPYTY